MSFWMVPCQIYYWACKWKNFENRPAFDEVIVESVVEVSFSTHTYIDLSRVVRRGQCQHTVSDSISTRTNPAGQSRLNIRLIGSARSSRAERYVIGTVIYWHGVRPDEGNVDESVVSLLFNAAIRRAGFVKYSPVKLLYGLSSPYVVILH